MCGVLHHEIVIGTSFFFAEPTVTSQNYLDMLQCIAMKRSSFCKMVLLLTSLILSAIIVMKNFHKDGYEEEDGIMETMLAPLSSSANFGFFLV